MRLKTDSLVAEAEQKVKIQAALEASLAEEIGRIESWGCDVKGVLLAVDGLEAQLKHLKEPKSKKKAEKGESRVGSEQIHLLSAPRHMSSSRCRGFRCRFSPVSTAKGVKNR